MKQASLLKSWMAVWLCVTVPTCRRPKSAQESPSSVAVRFAPDPGGSLTGMLAKSLDGGAISEYTYRQSHDARETQDLHGYRPEQGVRLSLISANVSNATVHPGDMVVVEATYALLCPDDQRSLKVTELRRVTLGKQEVARIPAVVTRGTGTYTSRVAITVPRREAAKGHYRVTVTVSAGENSAEGSSSFDVK